MPIGRRHALLLLQNGTRTSQTGSPPACDKNGDSMAFLLGALSGLAVVGFGVARLKARRNQKRTVQTLFAVVKK